MTLNRSWYVCTSAELSQWLCCPMCGDTTVSLSCVLPWTINFFIYTYNTYIYYIYIYNSPNSVYACIIWWCCVVCVCVACMCSMLCWGCAVHVICCVCVWLCPVLSCDEFVVCVSCCWYMIAALCGSPVFLKPCVPQACVEVCGSPIYHSVWLCHGCKTGGMGRHIWKAGYLKKACNGAQSGISSNIPTKYGRLADCPHGPIDLADWHQPTGAHWL